MGLDAIVSCRCWQEGVASPPPFPAEWLGFGEEMLFGPLPPRDNDDETLMAFFDWAQTACGHPDMRVTSQYIANWVGYRLFQDALSQAGWQHFPALRDHLPDNNSGWVPSVVSATALRELKYFTEHAAPATTTLLLDEDTDGTVMTYVPAHNGVVHLSPGLRAGVDPAGFFVRVDDRTVFRSMRFEQVVDHDGVVKLVDGVNVFHWPHAPLGWPAAKRLRVTQRHRTVADFDYIMKPLTTVFQASAETGNPVVWL